ncbi:hypothetical protein EDC04DRAFT_2774045 [Pisolithus marmoratus]|nr:hypothetical protein EDC04DRAFT_2774045 [Pisolithus marmoratus]
MCTKYPSCGDLGLLIRREEEEREERKIELYCTKISSFIAHTCILVSTMTLPDRYSSYMAESYYVASRYSRTRRFYRSVYLLLIGTTSLESLFYLVDRADTAEWQALKGHLVNRTSCVMVVGSLVTAASTSFVTSKPPSPVAAWDSTPLYICFFCGNLFSAWCVMSGLGLVMFLSTVQPAIVIREVQMSKPKFTVAFLLLAMPFFWLFIGTSFFIAGMTGALWLGNSSFGRVAVVVAVMGFIVTSLVIFASLF